jgi:hypothetical protein
MNQICVGILIPFNFEKLHCILIAMSCMPLHDHLDSFAIVVSIAFVAFCSVLLLPRYDKFFGVPRQYF